MTAVMEAKSYESIFEVQTLVARFENASSAKSERIIARS